MSEAPKRSILKAPWTHLRGAIAAFVALIIVLAVLIFSVVMAANGSTNQANSFLFAMVALVSFIVEAFLLIWLVRWLCDRNNLRRFAFTAACVVTVIALLLTAENWRSYHAWNRYRIELEARGERFTVSEVAPPPVPDDQNFVMTPLLKPIFEFTRTNGLHWLDTNAYDYLLKFSLWDSSLSTVIRPKLAGDEESGKLTDLTVWRDYYRLSTNSPQPTVSQSPAADVLVALSRFHKDIDELHQAAATRPYSRFPIKYDTEPGWSILLPHLANVKSIAGVVNLRAICELDLARSNDALEDLRLGIRLAESVKDEPTLISQVVRYAILTMDLQTVSEGIARHSWSDAQLAEIEAQLAPINLLAGWKRGMQGEQTLGADGLDYLRTHGAIDFDDITGGWFPAGRLVSLLFPAFYYQNMVTTVKLHQTCMFPSVDEKARRIYPEICDAIEKQIPEWERTRFLHPYRFMSVLLFPALSSSVAKTGEAQLRVDAGRLACALERYRLANGTLPDSLDVLKPKYIDKIPTDTIDGQPLRYRKNADGNYVIYSIGWNKIDDGGTIGRKPDGKGIDRKAGDWVWFSLSK